MSLLDRLDQLHADATPGPWVRRDGSHAVVRVHSDTLSYEAIASQAVPGHEDHSRITRENAELIAEYRNAMPHLVAALRRIREMQPKHYSFDDIHELIDTVDQGLRP